MVNPATHLNVLQSLLGGHVMVSGKCLNPEGEAPPVEIHALEVVPLKIGVRECAKGGVVLIL